LMEKFFEYILPFLTGADSGRSLASSHSY